MTGDATEAVTLYGTEQPPAPVQRFAQGPLSFDLEAGKLRYIRLAGIEVLRSIAFVVRGPGWESPAAAPCRRGSPPPSRLLSSPAPFASDRPDGHRLLKNTIFVPAEISRPAGVAGKGGPESVSRGWWTSPLDSMLALGLQKEQTANAIAPRAAIGAGRY